MKNELKDYYAKQNLPEDKLQRLMEIQTTKSNWKIPAISSFAVATLLFVAFNVIFQTPIDQKILKEVAYNHSKQMPPEVLSEDYTTINEALDRLDFKVVESPKLAANFQLVGARYCSVQGKIAAQLKLFNKQDQTYYTLYQFKAIDEVDNFQGTSKNVSIKVWKENEIGFALARDLP